MLTTDVVGHDSTTTRWATGDKITRWTVSDETTRWTTEDEIRKWTTESDTTGVITPRNIAILAGRRCVLNCRPAKRTSITARWLHFAPGESKGDLLYNGFGVFPIHAAGYVVEGVESGSRNLVIASVQLSHAGHYAVEEAGSLLKASAELIVIGKLIPIACQRFSALRFIFLLNIIILKSHIVTITVINYASMEY